MYVLRFNSNGSPDTGFGTNGVANIDLAGPGTPLKGSGANAIAIDAQGRIMVAGFVVNGSQFEDWLVIRLTSAGALDPTWQGTSPSPPGTSIVSVQNQEQDFAEGIAVQGDGNVVVVGSTKSGQFAMVRFTSAGQLDPSFGAAGKVFVDNKITAGTAVRMLPDGKIIVSASKSVLSPSAGQPGATEACTPVAPHPKLSSGLECGVVHPVLGRTVPATANGQARPELRLPNGEQTMPINSKGNGTTKRSRWRSRPTARSWSPGAPDVATYTYSNSGNNRDGQHEPRLSASARLNPDGSIDTTIPSKTRRLKWNHRIRKPERCGTWSSPLGATNGRPIAAGHAKDPSASGLRPGPLQPAEVPRRHR